MGLCRNDGDGLTEPIGDVVRHDDAGSRLSRLDSHGRIALDPDDVTAADLDGLLSVMETKERDLGATDDIVLTFQQEYPRFMNYAGQRYVYQQPQRDTEPQPPTEFEPVLAG